MPDLTPPEDQTITTLFVGNVGTDMKDADIRDKFYSFGEIKSIKKLDSASCAFVTFADRAAAERVSRPFSAWLLPGHDEFMPGWVSGLLVHGIQRLNRLSGSAKRDDY
jgi:RNA recognition motif-containing protein